MSLKKVGFFFEFSENDQRDRLCKLRQPNPQPHESQIVEYLLSGVPAGIAMTVEHDVLKTPPQPLGEATLRSDGEWIWPSSLAYYVDNYHLPLPQEFVAKMEECQWIVSPSLVLTDDLPDGHIEM